MTGADEFSGGEEEKMFMLYYGRPVPTYNPHNMTRLFPELLSFGRGDISEFRPIDMSMEEYIKNLGRLSHRRFAQDEAFMLVYDDILNRSKALRSMATFGKASLDAVNEVTPDQIKNAIEIKEAEFEARRANRPIHIDPSLKPALDTLKIIEVGDATLPTSNGMRKVALKQLYSYWYTFGCPSLFFTFAPDDMRNFLLRHYSGMERVPDILKSSIDSPQRDIVAVAKWFHLLIDLFVENILGFDPNTKLPKPEGGLFGKCLAYYGVVETQGRGALHIHMPIWIAACPTTTQALQNLDEDERAHFETWANQIVSERLCLEQRDLKCPTLGCPGTGLDFTDSSQELEHRTLKGPLNSLVDPNIVVCSRCGRQSNLTRIFGASTKQIMSNYSDAALFNLFHVGDFGGLTRDEFIESKLSDALNQLNFIPDDLPNNPLEQLRLASIEMKTNKHNPAHTETCFPKNGTGCRFHFPQVATDEIYNAKLTFDDETGLPKLQLPRPPGHCWINSHHPLLTLMFRSNTDIKIITGGVNQIAFYVVNYTAKNQNRLYSTVEVSQAVIVRRVAIREERDMTAGDATSRSVALGTLVSLLNARNKLVENAGPFATFCLYSPNKKTSQIPPFVRASHDCVRLSCYQLGTWSKEGLLLQRHQQTTDKLVTSVSPLVGAYIYRPEQLEKTNIYEFVREFEVKYTGAKKKKNNNKGNMAHDNTGRHNDNDQDSDEDELELEHEDILNNDALENEEEDLVTTENIALSSNIRHLIRLYEADNTTELELENEHIRPNIESSNEEIRIFEEGQPEQDEIETAPEDESASSSSLQYYEPSRELLRQGMYPQRTPLPYCPGERIMNYNQPSLERYTLYRRRHMVVPVIGWPFENYSALFAGDKVKDLEEARNTFASRTMVLFKAHRDHDSLQHGNEMPWNALHRWLHSENSMTPVSAFVMDNIQETFRQRINAAKAQFNLDEQGSKKRTYDDSNLLELPDFDAFDNGTEVPLDENAHLSEVATTIRSAVLSEVLIQHTVQTDSPTAEKNIINEAISSALLSTQQKENEIRQEETIPGQLRLHYDGMEAMSKLLLIEAALLSESPFVIGNEIPDFPHPKLLIEKYQLNVEQTAAFSLLAKTFLFGLSKRILTGNASTSLPQIKSLLVMFKRLRFPNDQLIMYLAGGGGSGKTLCLKALHEFACKWGNENGIAFTATTASAAILINGTTIHHWIGKGYKSNSGLNAFRARIQDVVLLIVDEVSMLGGALLMDIHERLTSAARGMSPSNPGTFQLNEDLPFGGLNICFCGDFFQLAPVRDEPLYGPIPLAASTISRNSRDANCDPNGYSSHKRKGVEGAKLFQRSVNAVIFLRKNYRMMNDPEYAALAQRACFGEGTKADEDMLRRQVWNQSTTTKDKQRIGSAVGQGEFKDIIRTNINAPILNTFAVSFDNKLKNAINTLHVMRHYDYKPSPIFAIRAAITSRNEQYTEQNQSSIRKYIEKHPSKFKDLLTKTHPRMYLAEGMPIKVTENAAGFPYGIVNGVTGIITRIIFPHGTKFQRTLFSERLGADEISWYFFEPTQEACTIVIKIDGEPHFSTFDGLERGEFPLSPLRRNFRHGETTCTSSQFPLELNFGKTGHGVQGYTVRSISIASWPSTTHKDFAQWVYVVLSRVTRLTDLIILGDLPVGLLRSIKPSKEMLRMIHTFKNALEMRTFELAGIDFPYSLLFPDPLQLPPVPPPE